MQPQVPLTLVGYSFGSRIIAGGLEFLGGGQINCCGLARQNTAPRVPLRAMLVAAGMDTDSLLPGHRDGEALSQVDQMLITVNDGDWVLKLYRRPLPKPRSGGPGYVGPASPACLGTEQAKLDLLDVTCTVGRDHHWANYVACSGVLAKIGPYTFRQPLTATAAANKEKPAAANARAARDHREFRRERLIAIMDVPQAYYDGRWISASELAVPVSDTGFVQGACIAEQLRTFRGRLFRLDGHLDRLFHCLELVGIDPGMPKPQFRRDCGATDRSQPSLDGRGRRSGAVDLRDPRPLSHVCRPSRCGPWFACTPTRCRFGSGRNSTAPARPW